MDTAVDSLWDELSIVESADNLKFVQKKPLVAAALVGFSDTEVLDAIRRRKQGGGEDASVKQVELEALLAVPEGYGDDVPVDPNFHARRLPDAAWRMSKVTDDIESVVQVHRLREVLSLAGFTRFEAMTPDIHGEYDSDVHRAQLAREPLWFPAVENRGEGVLLTVKKSALNAWLERAAVRDRIATLVEGHERWVKERKVMKTFPGGTYVMLHTLSHLLIQSISMRCGYPASSIRERIYVEEQGYGILLYTANAGAEGTLGGLVQQARSMDAHLAHALHAGALCSGDPICAQHTPGESLDGRWLHGAACHSCCLIAETSCEMRNDYLDRSLVVEGLGGQ